MIIKKSKKYCIKINPRLSTNSLNDRVVGMEKREKERERERDQDFKTSE